MESKATGLEDLRAQANRTRYRPGQRSGHYESFFMRANHPSRPHAFWIRYTIFSPQRHPEQAIGELWAVWFDGESGHHVAVKKEVPFTRCAFSNAELLVTIDDARLQPGMLVGSATSGSNTIAWELSFRGNEQPLFLLPLKLYDANLPKAKSLVALPLAMFSGSLSVDGRMIDITDWVGSQNHNWGSKHTDHYAWAQVAGFDTHPRSFLEVATARLKFGPLWTPFMTTLVLRHGGQEFALNSLRQAFRARGSFDYFSWRVASETDAVRIDGTLRAPRDAFVGLRYMNPPGGIKHCLNSKIAACELTVVDKRAARTDVLATAHRAAFEIVTDDRDHGIAIRV